MDEFFIGYLPRIPNGIAKTAARAVAGLLALALMVALSLVFGQRPFSQATFEYGEYRDFAGFIEAAPYPALLVPRPADSGYSRYLLVSPGKHGADAEVAGLDRKHVHLRGSLIYRDTAAMVELLPGSLRLQNTPQGYTPEAIAAGPVTLIGEIVDSKCYLGVMNPGQTKVHRDCAVRCISGGIPPAFVTKDGFYLLTGAGGRKLNREVLDVAGETIEVRGMAVRSGDTLILEAEPVSFRRVRNISVAWRP